MGMSKQDRKRLAREEALKRKTELFTGEGDGSVPADPEEEVLDTLDAKDANEEVENRDKGNKPDRATTDVENELAAIREFVENSPKVQEETRKPHGRSMPKYFPVVLDHVATQFIADRADRATRFGQRAVIAWLEDNSELIIVSEELIDMLYEGEIAGMPLGLRRVPRNQNFTQYILEPAPNMTHFEWVLSGANRPDLNERIFREFTLSQDQEGKTLLRLILYRRGTEFEIAKVAKYRMVVDNSGSWLHKFKDLRDAKQERKSAVPGVKEDLTSYTDGEILSVEQGLKAALRQIEQEAGKLKHKRDDMIFADHERVDADIDREIDDLRRELERAIAAAEQKRAARKQEVLARVDKELGAWANLIMQDDREVQNLLHEVACDIARRRGELPPPPPCIPDPRMQSNGPMPPTHTEDNGPIIDPSALPERVNGEKVGLKPIETAESAH